MQNTEEHSANPQQDISRNILVAIVVFLTVADQFTKVLIQHFFFLGEGSPVIPGFFDLRYIQNTGAAWGMFAGFNHWLVVFSFVILGLLIRFRHHLVGHHPLERIALTLMLSGIIGNLIDRMRLGYVVDFLDFYFGNKHFPAFNIADAAITLGVFVYFAAQLLQARTQSGETAE